MRKFGAFPITVNYNLHTQLRFNRKEDDLYRAGRRQEEKQLYIKASTTSDAMLENNLYKQEIDRSVGIDCLPMPANDRRQSGRANGSWPD